MTSVIYASLSAFLIVWLSLNVIKKRRKYGSLEKFVGSIRYR
jgi:uncharacterized membrane protein YecN with MAPEG domain